MRIQSFKKINFGKTPISSENGEVSGPPPKVVPTVFGDLKYKNCPDKDYDSDVWGFGGGIPIYQNIDLGYAIQKINDTYKYENLAGMDNILEEIKESIELPLRYPEVYSHLGIKSNRNMLLYGAPGCGKTVLAKTIANESGANLFVISGPELKDKYVGETERKMREVFKKASKNQPAMIFIDEFDSVAPQRSDAGENKHFNDQTNQFLTLIDNLKKENQDVFVIAATNKPKILDSAAIRNGRFDKIIEIPNPDEKAVRAILELKLRSIPTEEELSIDDLVSKIASLNPTGAGIEAIVENAKHNSAKRYIYESINRNRKIDTSTLNHLKLTEDDLNKGIELYIRDKSYMLK